MNSVVLDLPLPPSVNRFIGRLGNVTPKVAAWQRDCDAVLIAQKFRPPRFATAVAVAIVWSHDSGGDVDNRCKPLLDFLQTREVIENDRLVRELHVTFGDAPRGCRVRVAPLPR